MPAPHIMPKFLLFGGAHLDQIGRPATRLEPGQSNPGHLNRSLGGVAANIAQSLAKLDWSVVLSTIVGTDSDGTFVRQSLEKAGIDMRALVISDQYHSASYTAIEEQNGALLAAIADMGIYDHYPTGQIENALSLTTSETILLADTNLSADALQTLTSKKSEQFLAICATSGPKANRAMDILADIDLLICNESEAAILADEFADLSALPHILAEEGVKQGIITKGNAGVTAWIGDSLHHLPAPPVKVKSSNGAGDCLAACILHGLALTGSLHNALPYGMAGASLALMSNQSVPEILNRTMLEACLEDTPTA